MHAGICEYMHIIIIIMISDMALFPPMMFKRLCVCECEYAYVCVCVCVCV